MIYSHQSQKGSIKSALGLMKVVLCVQFDRSIPAVQFLQMKEDRGSIYSVNFNASLLRV